MKSKLEKYSRLISERIKNYDKGITRIEVSSKYELSQKQKDRILNALTKIYGKNIILTSIIDPSLIGGVALKINSQTIDSSLRTKLKQIINTNEKEGVLSDK
ncbi:hypothetical protein JM47_00895 [Ureaplasma diversum]|uniref:ATP synthase delta chain n=2 Tax=Ureaplasma diversum TaxID=42094 RepID=A0A084EXN7_9BACT|nr:F0F1 ATP synthase subunit delta [Ureaplasma diversum]AJQ45199.1 hypothetical protein JM47_00895 [Ureaplasma diversum]KEZ22729.1 ATP synthase delta chain [Ureaplasma diversum NCTC 246]